MQIAVIGANGFVGKAICRILSLRQDVELIPLTRTEFDLCRPESWGKFPQVDCVVHAASRIDGTTYDIFKANALTARLLAEHLNAARVKKMIYLSSGAVYGPTQEFTHPKIECNPKGDYAVSKYLAEQETAATFAGTLYILRLYFPYGPGQLPPRLMPNITAKINANKPIMCNEDGGPKISLTHVDDISETIIDIALLPIDSGKKKHIYNVSSDTNATIEEISMKLARETGKDPIFAKSGASPNCLSLTWPPRKFRPFF